MQSRKPTNPLLVDLSKWQGHVDWKRVAESTVDGRKVEAVMIKATEGYTYIDPYLREHFTGAKSHGLGVGLYHFCRAKNVQEAEKEAAHFIQVLESLGGIQALDLLPALDIETVEAHTKDDVTAIALKWLLLIEAHTRFTPMLYSYPYFITKYLDGVLADYPLWLADYDHNTPPNYGGWTEWHMLQFTSKGHVPGFMGYVDLNEAEGEWRMYRMAKEDADKLIQLCTINWGMAKSKEDKDHWHHLANELRIVSGQKPTAPL